MTVTQKQCLLKYLGYDPGAIDGIWGTASRNATESFQRDNGLVHDGDFGAKTEEKARENFAKNVFRAENAGTEEKATATAQQGQESGGSFWSTIRYFTRAEFRCPCGECGGFPVEPEEGIVRFADNMRQQLGKQMIIVPPDGHSGGSGVRCRAYNATFSNSATNSAHIAGKAIDFSMPGAAPADIRSYLEKAKQAGVIRYWYAISQTSYHANI